MVHSDPLLENLNPKQQEAVTAGDGPILVLAGPGSGKTRVLTHRVAWLIARRNIPPWKIVAVTFTNKAAKEMKDRLLRIIGPQAVGQLTAGTFHAICARWLRVDGKHLGVESNFVIYDGDDQQGAIKQAVEELELDEKRFRPGAVLARISKAKSELKDPKAFSQSTLDYWDEAVARVYKRYADILTRNNALDFDDLLMKVAQLFEEFPEILQKYQDKYEHILVDEFQDTNPAQYAIVKHLAARHKNILVVGDPDQSIYAFRSADIRNILNFEHDFPQARTILLEQNYRSTQTILDTAHAVIIANRKRKKKNLWTENDAGVPVALFEAYNENEEADFVVSEIERMVARGQVRPRECAVMYRTNAQSRALEDAFVKHGVPYRLVGATRFYERKEVKDVMAYLRVIHNPDDGISLNRIINVPPRGIGAKTLAALQQSAARKGVAPVEEMLALAAEQQTADGRRQTAATVEPPSAVRRPPSVPRLPPIDGRARRALTDLAHLLQELFAAREVLNALELLDLVLERTAYGKYVRDGTEEGEGRWENVMELRTVAEQFSHIDPPEGLRAFLEDTALVSDIDNYDASADATTLLTLHMAKGLEFPVVFITGLEEGIIPHSRSMEDPDAMEEERRLFYVGITRAMQRLYLLYTFRRSHFGRSDTSEPSQFLRDIPQDLLKSLDTRSALVTRAAARAGQTKWAPEGAETAPLRKRNAVGAGSPRPANGNTQFRPGDKVRHASFGDGLVIQSESRGDDEEITVIFAGQKPKKLLQSFANLTKI